ncbi:TonB-dependent receptor plug domain-containing protein [Sphingomicrobium aestuariivivum]|uniref:TonB-dependent receptor plug domain-containing protein n=1 Tax=Sphingomicrobium aestuariivivum TaxID=1582356 RepID=UPI001FD6389E|nr:TonB-dependent receptor [Sphingomicrobium aestuariivivum]MCJ8189953.1 TonB-dependent receptor [Sphingomicrobium aestuariivivum]
MRRINRTLAGSSLAAVSLALFSTPAFAQQTDDTDEPGEVAVEEVVEEMDSPYQDDTVTNADGSAGDAIVITGSRIRRDEFSTTEPITVITREEVTQAGFNSAAELLQSNQVSQGSAQINNYYGGFVVDGGTGVNTIGLRGLGPARTLVLLNGHRLAPAGTRGSVGAVDANVLPSAMLERVEILQAGASSVYGSDAVAGVVNIITDRGLEGLVLEGQANIPEIGAGVERRISASFGNQSDRFGFIGSVEYYKRDAVRLNDVDFTSCPIEGYLDGAGSELGSGDYIDPLTGAPKCFTIFNGGVTINTLGLPRRVGVDRETGALGVFNRFVPAPGVAGTPDAPELLGVNLYTRDSFDPRSQLEEIVTPAEILTGYAQLTYDLDILGDAEAYLEVLGNRRESSSILYRQLSLDYSTGSPLIPEAYRDGIFLLPNEITNGNFAAARAFIGFGNTNTAQEVNFYRVGGGLRGDFLLDDWRYDAWLSFSGTDATYENETFLTDRIARSLDVTEVEPGVFVCNTTSDPNCVPAPYLDAATIGGDLPQAYKDYILANVIGTTKYDETVVALAVDGPVFEMPGGDVQLALGAEYRDASIDDQPPADSVNGNLYNLTSASPTVGSDSVWEVFGEVFVPILGDVPGAYTLNLNGSARYTEYDSYGGDWTYKVAGEWEPIRGLGFRGSYGTSYRAPALFEQFLGATSGFLSSSADPCDDYGNSNNPIVVANCASIGLPADFQQNSGITVFNLGGAGAGLEAETSTNFGAGVVLQPRLPAAWGDLSIAVDYFDIEINNGVSQVGAGSILSRCYGDPNFSPSTGFCRLVVRDANNELTVNNSYINLATDKVRGFDLNLRYARNFGDVGAMLTMRGTKFEEQSNKLFEEEFLTDFNGIITAPEWSANAELGLDFGDVALRYGVDFVSGSPDYTYQYFTFDEGTGEFDPDLEEFYRSIFYLESPDYWTHYASVQFDVTEDFQLTAGVRNLFDAELPQITAVGFSTYGNTPLYSGYDYIGRRFFINATAKF